MPRRLIINTELDPANPGPILTGLAKIEPRGRCRLPADLLRHAGWLTASGQSIECLAALRRPGSLVLLPWLDRQQVIIRRNELISQSVSDPRAQEALFVLASSYRRFEIPGDLRPTLSPELRIHLEIPEGAATLHVASSVDRLVLSSPAELTRQRSDAGKFLEGLPS